MKQNKEFTSWEGPICPNCKHIITADENHYYDEMEYKQDECPDCGTIFKVQVIIESYWITELK